ncbi:MAG: twin arginine-targeting protein translocase TatB [Caulobacterales bacterium 32-69-10]|nr:MAG: twin arginine-targeting protein translocase TatB [Caulobacterales bacterium 32-69-10]
MLPDSGAIELIFLAAVALIVVGPKDLPVLMRKVGQWIGKMRGLAAEFRSSFEELARQSELDELRKEVEALRNARDPFNAVHPTIEEISTGLSEDPFEQAVGAPADPHAEPDREYPAVGPGFGLEPSDAPAAPPKPKRAPRKKAAAEPEPAPEPTPEAKPAPKPRRTTAAKAKAPAKPRAKRAAPAESKA